MKKEIWLSAFLSTWMFLNASAQQNGDLDSSFNATGKILTDFGGTNDGASSVLIQPDGKILVAGYSAAGNNYSFALSRYEINGSLDTSFGGTGKVLTDFAPGYDYAGAIALQPDGKIVAAGVKWNGTSGENALIRYEANGTMDTTFGAGGKVYHPIGIGDAGIGAVMVQPDGKIVAAGICTTISGGHDFAVTRYNSDGSLDNSFGANGISMVDFTNSYDFAFTAALQNDGKILVGGASGQDPLYDFGLIRLDTLGLLDSSFGTGGKVTTNFGRPDEWGNALAIQNDGKIVLTGMSGSPYNIAVARYNTDGVLDTTFNQAGTVLTAISSHDEANAIAIQTDQRIVVAGVSFNGSNHDFCMVRYNTDGTSDSTFSSDGKLTTDFGTNADKATGVAVQPDGKIVAAGVAGSDFAVARYLGNLSTGIIDFATMDHTVFIYPNPVEQQAILKYSLKQTENISINLQDMQGRVVYTFIQNQLHTAGNYEQPLLFPGTIQHGIYFIVIGNGNRQMSIQVVK